jgi:tripartite-type tricarboxylate transporter receptor subunit TctC
MRSLLLAVFLLAPGAAFADPVEDFYRDKSVTIFVGYAAGGGYDQYARLLARHLGRFVPGHPAMLVKNMPGAGSMNALNHIYNAAPKDGTAMATFGPEVAFEPLRGGEGVKFDTLHLTWVGSMNRQVGLIAMRADSGIKTVLDARTRPVVVGASGPASQSNLNPQVFNAFLGTKFKVITGYPGTKDITLAMEKKELEGIAGWSWDSLKLERPAWRNDPSINLVMQLSDRRHPELSAVPNLYDYVDNPDEKAVLELIFGHQLLGRPFAMPPAVPEARVAAMRKAFDDTMRDEKFLAEAANMRLEIDVVGGAEIAAHVARIFAMPKPLIEKAAVAIRNAAQAGTESK